jgi:hypothetical protein
VINNRIIACADFMIKYLNITILEKLERVLLIPLPMKQIYEIIV